MPMQVVKRNGKRENACFVKLSERLSKLIENSESSSINIAYLARKIYDGLCDGISTAQIDSFASETCAALVTTNIEYQNIASKILISNLHKETKNKFSQVITDLYNAIDPITSERSKVIAEDVFKVVEENKDLLDITIVDQRDFHIEYFGYKTLKKTYLMRIDKEVVERPQYMFMRVAIGIHKQDIKAAIETYHLMSNKWFIHATPTLINAGTTDPQLSSCFLLTMKEDSIEGIYDTLKNCALISKHNGGIGLNIHCLRSAGLYNNLPRETSYGIIPMLQLFNDTARFVHQGGNKRPGAIAIYLEPWHADIVEFIQLRKNYGDETKRTRDLFLALWIPDLFMKRVQNDEDWALMNPYQCRNLFECWGDEFERLYKKYEADGKVVKIIKARQLWKEILESQMETGTPYMLYKDSCNRKSNHKHLGTLKGSNLCAEIMQYSSPDEVAVCNLASVSLPRFVNEDDRSFDFEKLIEVVGVVTTNLNKIIDVNQYPIEEAKRSSMRSRSIGIGVQGLADVFALLRYPYDSPESQSLNRKIFETIYFAAMRKSCDLACQEGPYEAYQGSPLSQGILQPDMWNVKCSPSLDWPRLRQDISIYGARNSLLVAAMPTASTAQIFGNNECFEPFTNNIYSRRVISGDFTIVNKYLVADLVKAGLWSKEMKDLIIADRGSVQAINSIPEEIKNLYKTVWEIPQSVIIKMAADRAPFIDQSQSMVLHISNPNYQNLTNFHLMAWKLGLKTGMYYLRTRPAADPIQFTIDKKKLMESNLLRKNIDVEKKELYIPNNIIHNSCSSCDG